MQKSTISSDLRKLTTNTIRTLSIDTVQKANSGHPGLPLGVADIAYALWVECMNYFPENPNWPNRDRFILSAGHGSALLYTMLYLSGYDISLDDLKQFRQWNSKTPGHPEYGHTDGVETTTGPLGQGFATGVGMAIAAKLEAEKYNKPKHEIFGTHNVFAIVSDGDLMEGISTEAASLAGHLELGNLIYIYDNNKITIEGKTSLTFSEDIKTKFEALGWQTISINGHTHIGIMTALEKAKKETVKPTLIIARTHIGYGSPNKQDTSDVHGAPLGDFEVRETKRKLGWPDSVNFFVPPEVKQLFKENFERQKERYDLWFEQYKEWKKVFPELAKQREIELNKELPEDFLDKLLDEASKIKSEATRSISGKLMQIIAEMVPGLIGGSADLCSSTKTYLNAYESIGTGKFKGRNLHFGIREHAMTAIMNGLALYGGIIPYGSTFLTFADYMKPGMRLAALMGLQTVYVLTHDSIYVGEDGPTHQPIDQVPMLRAIPNMTVIRPADSLETAFAWNYAVKNKKGPTSLILTRQKLPEINTNVKVTWEEVKKGGYVVWGCSEDPDVVIVATGSEVDMAFKVKEVLNTYDFQVRIVSMPSREVFIKQDEEYKETVIPVTATIVAVLEAASPSNWQEITSLPLTVVGINTFGASAPAGVLAENFFTATKTAHEIDRFYGRIEDIKKKK